MEDFNQIFETKKSVHRFFKRGIQLKAQYIENEDEESSDLEEYPAGEDYR